MKQAPNRPRRVLYIITKATWGGAQRYVYDLITHLPKDQFESIVAYGTHGKLAEDLNRAGHASVRIPSLGRDLAFISDLKSFFDVWRMVRMCKPDIIHLNSSKAAALGALAARFSGVSNIVFTVHGWPFKEERSRVSRVLIRFVSWFTALLSHSIIVISRTDERITRTSWLIGPKVVYIPLGIARMEFATPAEGFAKIFGGHTPPQLTPDVRRLITIGELTANKGIRYGISAIVELARRGIDCIYVIAGEGEERASLERLAKRTGVADRVFFAGFVPNVARYLLGFDTLVLPSLKEGTPYVILEAALAGLPIVATSVIDAELETSVGALTRVPPGDEYALADSIEKMSERGRSEKKPESWLPLSDMVRRTIELYG